jgi:dTDP-glucose 4,6-dehydratase
MTILVTGGLGFIGSNFIRKWLFLNKGKVINLDCATYAGNPLTMADLEGRKDYVRFTESITSPHVVSSILKTDKPRIIFNFAAESHVDNSIENSLPFARTNILGTINLLEQVRIHSPETLFVHISTDEVFGSLGLYEAPFNENSGYAPRSPYAASKASSDHFVRAYRETYRLNTIITNCSNNYGPYQHPEKFIPTVIRKALADERVPIYGAGTNIRDWLHVDDHCTALIRAAEEGIVGDSYCIGGGTQKTNLQLAMEILGYLGKSLDSIQFVDDRKGHDFRYDIDSDKLFLHTGWKPIVRFDRGLSSTIDWYIRNQEWVNSCVKRSESFSQAGNLLDYIPRHLLPLSKSSPSTTNPLSTIP